jgi:hypothetical protein
MIGPQYEDRNVVPYHCTTLIVGCTHEHSTNHIFLLVILSFEICYEM